jgi:hypothetical protein
MSYPFTNNRYAQTSSQGHRGYNDPYEQRSDQYATSGAPYHSEEAPSQGGQQSSYDEQPDMMSRDPQMEPATGTTAPYNVYSDRQNDLYDAPGNEKFADGGAYERSPYVVGATPYAGKSIWTSEDKRVMARRSVPAKLFR